MKNIAICGEGYTALTLYIGGLLSALGEKVIITDAVCDRPIDYCLNVPKEIEIRADIYSYKGIDYTRMENVPSSSHTVMISLYGTKGPIEESDMIIAVFKESGEAYARMLGNAYPTAAETILVIEDSLGLATREFKAFAKEKGFRDIITLPMNKKDIAARLRLELASDLAIRKTSGQMQKFLFNLIHTILPDTDEKAFAKAVKKCEKGGRR